VGATRILFHDGGGEGWSAQLDVYPELGLSVAVLSNYDPPAAMAVANELRRIISA
jgi:hypothetical protein